MEGRAIDNLVVRTSPFIRTMATCARICKQINVQNVELDYNYAEWMATYLYAKNPIPSLEVRNKTADEIEKEFSL